MNSGVILGIVVTIITAILGIIATLWPSEFKERIQKLRDLFKSPQSILIYPPFRPILYILWGHIPMFSGVFQNSPQSSLAKIKYTVIISVLGVFLCIAIILACTGDFDLQIFHIIGCWTFCFLVLLMTEQIGEKGDKYTQPS